MKTDNRQTGEGEDTLDACYSALPEKVQLWIMSLPIQPGDLDAASLRISYSYEWTRELAFAETRQDEAEWVEKEFNEPENFTVVTDSQDYEIPFDLWRDHLKDFEALISGESHIL